MILSDEAVNQAAATAVAKWIQGTMTAGFSTVAQVNERDGGRALERSIAVFLEASTTEHYAEEAERLFQAGVRDSELNLALTQTMHRINIQILRKLVELGFKVDALLDQYESGIIPTPGDFALDNH